MTALPYRWTGEAWEVLPRAAKEAEAAFVVGEVRVLAPLEARSAASHSHFFACVHDAWANLPEREAERFPTAEHLRKWALIKSGFHDSHSIVCASKAEALRVAAFVRPADEFAVVIVSGATVTRYTAKSQSMKAMGKETFSASKDAVLATVSDLIGVEPAQLGRAA